jgi:hypothetical protein
VEKKSKLERKKERTSVWWWPIHRRRRRLYWFRLLTHLFPFFLNCLAAHRHRQ